MLKTVLYLTDFRVEKLRCVGAGRGASPYRITPVQGAVVGTICKVMEPGIEAHRFVPEMQSPSWKYWFASMPRRIFGR